MRAPSSDLYELIQRLNKEEKKQVTIYLNGLGKRGVGHLRLFNAIAKQKEYDEKVLKQTFKTGTFSVAKKRLYDLIIDVLLLSEKGDDIVFELLKGLQVFRVLIKKELYTKAIEELNKLEELAYKREQLDYLPLIQHNQIAYQVNTGFQDFDDAELATFFDEIKTSQIQFFNRLEYRDLVAQFYYYAMKKIGSSEVNWKEIDAIKEHRLFANVEAAKSNLAKYRFYDFHLMYYNLKKDLGNALSCGLKLIAFYEENLLSIRSIEEYFVCLLDTVNMIFSIARSHLPTEIFEKMDQTVLLVKVNQSMFKLRYISFKANYYLNIGDVAAGHQMMTENEDWIIAQKDLVDISTVSFYFSILYFLAGDYKQALNLIEYTIERGDSINGVFKYWGKLFKLVIFYESGEYNQFESLNRSLYRKFYTEKETYQMELILVNALKNLVETNKGEKVVLTKLSKVLLLEKDERGFYKRRLFELFDYIAWTESKLTNQPMERVLAQNALNRSTLVQSYKDSDSIPIN